MDSMFMQTIANGLADLGQRVVRFEFPYMHARRHTGKKSPPNRMSILLETWRDVIQHIAADHLFIGGKSMGGRAASMICDEIKTAGLICLGYPFHPPGKPDKLRTEHLAGLKTPGLFVQGERDPFGKKEEVEKYNLSRQIQFAWMLDGDHSFKPRKKSGRTESENLNEAVTAITKFIQNVG